MRRIVLKYILRVQNTYCLLLRIRVSAHVYVPSWQNTFRIILSAEVYTTYQDATYEI